MKAPDWRAVTYEALTEPASLMRVFAGLGFGAYLGTIERGAVKWWPPAYLTTTAKSPHRPCYARINRAMRDASVHLLADGLAVTAVCGYDGEWRTADGAQRGDDLASLGALRWSCRYGQAAARIAKIIGLAGIPQVEPITSYKVWAEIRERLRGTVDA